MDLYTIKLFAERQGDDFVEVVMKNGKTITGKRLRESNFSRTGSCSVWEIDEEERFPVQLEGSEIASICFVN